jgi:hypothetical protein
LRAEFGQHRFHRIPGRGLGREPPRTRTSRRPCCGRRSAPSGRRGARC